VVRTEKELVKAAAEWPATRLVELWNSFAGVAPFTDCKPVKKFENRDKAVARIWAAISTAGQHDRTEARRAGASRGSETGRREKPLEIPSRLPRRRPAR
jgi:hypothetical protein